MMHGLASRMMANTLLFGGTLAEDKDDFAGPPEFCIRFKIRAFSSSFERGSEDAF